MTVISSDGSGTEQVGRNVASQLATATQIVKDLVGIDIAEVVNGRAAGSAAGEAIAAADQKPKRVATAKPKVESTSSI
jgi:flotillin